MKIRPLHDRVVVRRTEEERTSPGGIVLPDSARNFAVEEDIEHIGRIRASVIEIDDTTAAQLAEPQRDVDGRRISAIRESVRKLRENLRWLVSSMSAARKGH